MLAALNPQARANGPGPPYGQSAAPISIQNSGAKSPSTAFSLAVSAAARRISWRFNARVSRPTIQLKAWRAGSSSLVLVRASRTACTACSRLRPARALARATNSSAAPIGQGHSRLRCSSHQPKPPLPRTNSRVIPPPASRRPRGESPQQRSASRRSCVIHQPITTTGCRHQRGSPIQRSSPAAASTNKKGWIPVKESTPPGSIKA